MALPLPPNRLNRRQLILGACKTMLAASVFPSIASSQQHSETPLRAINVMNFLRAEEPRQPTDLFEPLREQMVIIQAHQLPATWLLQYDALVEGPFVEFLKTHMPANHEIGLWFEMNRRLCDDAGIPWRGNPQWEWDYHVPVAYAIGYPPAERRRLADTAVATFRRIFGHAPRSVASWNLDAVSAAHFSGQYAVDAFANCRDQLATDGYTIWGAPIAGYYPSRQNAWSPAQRAENQIATPMFRLLGQDPVYYYDNRLPNPDTMEPVWPSGQSPIFVENFLNMIARAPSQSFAYAQLGQENSFGWPDMRAAYPMQMDKLARLRNTGAVLVETMSETGRRFKRAFPSSPTQAQVMLDDPFGNASNPERTVWYQSKFLRANLHFRGHQFYLRDLHVYDDRFSEPYLTEPARQHGIEQRMLAVLDGYHWSDDATRAGHPGVRAMGSFVAIGSHGQEAPLTLSGLPTVSQTSTTLQTTVPLARGGRLVANFAERAVEFSLDGGPPAQLALVFIWVPERSTLERILPNQLQYRFRDFGYSVRLENATATAAPSGVRIIANRPTQMRLILGQ